MMSKQLRLALLPCACLAVLFCAEVQPKAQADTDQPTFLVYGYQDLLDLIGEGGSVAADGEYTVWIKAREGSGCQVSIGKVDFSTHSKGNGTTYSWEKAGTVNLKADEHFHLRLDVSRPLVGQEAGQDIAQMVLTQDPGANPERIDEISLVFPDRLSPPHDRRLWDIRHLNRYYTWPGYESKEEWQRRAEDLREHIKVSCGLWPEPDRCPLNARIFGRIERDGYSIEKVFFESYPGFFVTGNLYRPLGKEGPFPAIASPHGHWGEGRLADKESGSVPGRCINFARQGYIIFSYDMVAYNDSKQLDPHRHWDPRGHLWAVNPLAIQTWNSIRVVDFLLSLDEVDPERIGCTGASGGGTQTFMLTSIDPRVKVAAPVNMISGHMQGGCVCENAPNLRVDAYNVEIGALAAPRPLILVCCTGDWTDETPWNEYPAIRSIYSLFDAEERVSCVQVDAGHNYNQKSREAVYAWFGRWFLGIEDAATLREKPFEVEDKEDLLVFADREVPDTGINWETLTDLLIEQAKEQLNDLRPTSPSELIEFQKLMRPALRHAIGAEKPSPEDIELQRWGRAKRSDYTIHQATLGRKSKDEQFLVTFYVPENVSDTNPATILVHPDGKEFFVDKGEAEPGELVTELLRKGHIVAAMDPFLCGEYHTPWKKTTRDDNDQFFSVYNLTDHACRIQDILTLVSFLEGEYYVELVNLVGLEQAGVWCLLARGLAPEIRSVAVDAGEIDLHKDETWLGDLFIPVIRRLGDIQTAVTLAAPARLLVGHADGVVDMEAIETLYRDISARPDLQLKRVALSTEDIVDWLE